MKTRSRVHTPARRLHALVICALLMPLFAIGNTTAAGAQQPSPQSDLDAIHAAGMPGIQAASRRGTETFDGAAGVANLRNQYPMQANWPHRVGSVTKTFTAVAVLQQVHHGKLDLDAPIARYLPEYFPDGRGEQITTRMLLNHTSGIGDYLPILFPSRGQLSLADMEKHRFTEWSLDELAHAGLTAPPTDAPGERWSYSNTNYILAGILLKKLTGQDAEQYITDNVIQPLGLTETYFPRNNPFILGPHSLAYEQLHHVPPRLGEYSTYNMTWAATAGALISTPSELNVFYRALLGGKLLPPDMLAEMKRTVPINDPAGGAIGRYGLALMAIDAGPCGTWWGHDGEAFGMGTMSLHSEDGTRQLSYGTNLTNYQHLDQDGLPKPHPIDAGTEKLMVNALCERPPTRAAIRGADLDKSIFLTPGFARAPW